MTKTTLKTYHWATDAASGTIPARDEHHALALLIVEGEWANLDSPREQRDIADGAWLLIGLDVPGERLIERGNK